MGTAIKNISKGIVNEIVVPIIPEPEGPPFDPMSLLPELWLDSSAASPFNDQSGNGHNFTGFNVLPTIDPVGINGHPAMRIIGSSSRAIQSGIVTPIDSDATFFIVFKLFTKSTNGMIYGQMNDFSVAESNYTHDFVANTTTEFYQTPGSGGSPISPTLTLATNTGYIHTTLYDNSANTTVKINNANATTAASMNYADVTLNYTYIGKRIIQDFMNGWIGDIFVFNRLLNSTEEQNMYAWLSNKYGI